MTRGERAIILARDPCSCADRSMESSCKYTDAFRRFRSRGAGVELACVFLMEAIGSADDVVMLGCGRRFRLGGLWFAVSFDGAMLGWRTWEPAYVVRDGDRRVFCLGPRFSLSVTLAAVARVYLISAVARRRSILQIR